MVPLAEVRVGQAAKPFAKILSIGIGRRTSPAPLVSYPTGSYRLSLYLPPSLTTRSTERMPEPLFTTADSRGRLVRY